MRAFLALALFLVLPGHPLSLVGGLPWGPLGLGCAVLLGLGLFAAWPPRGRWLSAVALAGLVLAVLKLGLALTAPRYGYEASYYANDRFHNEPESSTAAPGTPYTRLDSLIDFGNDEFPLYFFNDSERFNSLGPDRLERGRTLTWSAVWNGHLNLAEPRTLTLWLTASGPGELQLDGRRLLRVDEAGRATAQAEVRLEPGSHGLQVRYARRRERSGFLRVESDLDGARRPLGSPTITAQPYPPDHLAAGRLATVAAQAVDGAFLLLLVAAAGLGVWRQLRQPQPSTSRPDQPREEPRAEDPRKFGTSEDGRSTCRANLLALYARLERPLLALVPLGFFLQAALPRLERYGKMVFLGGGQDWLTHETLARDIQFNGPLMTLGKPLGQGALYYAQPLYPYYLALLHTLAGEDLFGVTTLQLLGLGVACVLMYYLAKRVFGLATALVALALLLGVLVPFELAWVARLLISEALYYWLMPAAILALVALLPAARLTRAGPRRDGDEAGAIYRAPTAPADSEGLVRWQGPDWRLSLLAGVLLGLACLTRGPTLLYLPPAGVLLWLGLRRAGLAARRAGLALGLVGLAAGVLIGLVPLRNAIVAGKPALTASSGGVNLQKLHRPSDRVRLGGVDDDPLYNALGLDRPTREVIEYARQDPPGYVGSYLPLAAYTLGFGSALNDLLDEQPVQLQPELLALNALYLLALVLVRRARSLEAGLLHAFIAIHFLTMVVFAPYDYENRLVTPMYLFVLLLAAVTLTWLGRLLVGRRRGAETAAAAGIIAHADRRSARP